MFKNNNSASLTNDKSSFLKNTEEARLKRQTDKKKLESAIVIQSFYRGYLTRKQQTDLFINELETAFISSVSSNNHQFSSIQIFNLIKKYFQLDRLTSSNNNNEKTNLIFINMLKYLLNQIQANTEFNKSYVSLIISAKNYQNFISQSNKLVDKCIQKLTNDISYTTKEKIKYFEIILAFLICLSNHKYWKCFQQQPQLEQLLKETTKSYLTKYCLLYGLFNRVLNQNLQSHCLLLNKTSVTSILCLSIQILRSLNYQSSILLLFCSNILTIPAIVNVYNTTSGSLKTELIDCDLSCRLYALFSDSSINEFLADKDLLQSISFLGNLCYLSDHFDSNFQFNLDNFIIISNKILDFSNNNNNNNNSTKLSDPLSKTETITWNPLFGYLKIKTSEGLVELLDQLRFLWSHKFIHLLFNDYSIKMNSPSSSAPVHHQPTTNFKTIIKNMFDKTILNMNSNRNTNDLLALLNHQSNSTVYRICSFYRKILSLITEPRIEILSALSYEQEFLFGLWRFFSLFLNNSNISVRDLCKFIEKEHPIFDVLFVLSSLLLYLLTIFDSNEIYSEQSILTKNDFKKLASFLNYFVYELIMRDLTETNWFNTFYQLLCVFYEKFRNEYEEEFWNLKDIKIKTFMNDLEKNNKKNLKILEKISWGKSILTFFFFFP